MNPPLFAGWTPIRLYWRGSQPMVDWCHLGETRFTDPFFDQTIGQVVQRPFNLLFRHQTPIEALEEINASVPVIAPTGFIFHMSRSGSTLISRMLAALPQNVVVAEAGLLDFLFRAHPQIGPIPDEQRIPWLRYVIGALGQRRYPKAAHYFVKFDSWHTLRLPLVRRAFPEVPWVFVYREPVDVLASHEREPAAQMLPGLVHPLRLELETEAQGRMPDDEYCARYDASRGSSLTSDP